MIDGLKVSLTGEEFRELLDERAARHRAAAAHWSREAARTSDDATEEEPVLPEHICRNEVAREEWRASVLTFLRERLDVSEVYRLGVADLEYVDVLPVEPEPCGPGEFEDRTEDSVDLGPFAERICASPEIVLVTNPDMAGE